MEKDLNLEYPKPFTKNIDFVSEDYTKNNKENRTHKIISALI